MNLSKFFGLIISKSVSRQWEPSWRAKPTVGSKSLSLIFPDITTCLPSVKLSSELLYFTGIFSPVTIRTKFDIALRVAAIFT